MKKTLRILSMTMLTIAVFFSIFVGDLTSQITAGTTLSNEEITSPSMEWRYLDKDVEVGVRESAILNDPAENGKLTGETEISGDPNAYTWFSRWNKRNGWAYPSDFLDHGLFNMDFSDEKWSSGTGKSFSTDATLTPDVELSKNADGTVRESYFLRYSFDIDNPADIYAITGNVTYKDAMIIYVNGKPVESLFNIPMSNYSKNMQYGSSETMSTPKNEDFLIEDVSSLKAGENTIAIEVHASDKDSEVFFALNSFLLNPSEENLPESSAVKAIAINAGADETKINFAWYSLSNTVGNIQIMEGNNVSAFNEAQARTINASEPVLAYTKFVDTYYYSNKLVVDNIKPGKNYVYRVGNSDAYSDVYELKTSDITNGYEAIFMSDPQIGTGTVPTDVHGWKQTLNSAFSRYPSANFIVNTGDFVDVATKEGEYDGYFVPEQLRNYPSATAVGNHDVAVNYKHHFNEPNLSNLGKSVANSNYYFTYGKVLYIVLNTSFTNNDEHIQYLEEVIEETKDMDLDWKVVAFHQSLYSGGTQATIPENIKRRNDLVPTFDKLGIDIALMGHDHGYVRTHQMKNFTKQTPGTIKDGYEVNPKGTLYLTSSSASGSKFYPGVENEEITSYTKFSKFGVPTYSHLSFKGNQFTVTTFAMNNDGSSTQIDEYSMEKDIDKTELAQAIADGESKNLDKYTSDSAQAYRDALAAAKQVNADQNARQSKIDEVLANLIAAKDALIELLDTPTQQTLSGLNGEVTVSGMLHDGVSLNVSRDIDASKNANFTKLKDKEEYKDYSSKAGYEISLSRSNAEYQPSSSVTVKIKQDSSLIDKTVKIAHVYGDTVELITPKLIDGFYVFETNHFSTFFVNVANKTTTTGNDETTTNSTKTASSTAINSGDTMNVKLYAILAIAAFGLIAISIKKKQIK